METISAQQAKTAKNDLTVLYDLSQISGSLAAKIKDLESRIHFICGSPVAKRDQKVSITCAARFESADRCSILEQIWEEDVFQISSEKLCKSHSKKYAF